MTVELFISQVYTYSQRGNAVFMPTTDAGISKKSQEFLDDFYQRFGVGESPGLRLNFLRSVLHKYVSSGLDEEQELSVLEFELLMQEGQVDPENGEPFPEKAQKLLDALYEGVGAQDALQRLEYWRKQQMSEIPSASDEQEELRMREFYYLTKLGVLE